VVGGGTCAAGLIVCGALFEPFKNDIKFILNESLPLSAGSETSPSR
jgi:hypothetical protein